MQPQSDYRYLDVMTVRASGGAARRQQSSVTGIQHSKLLVEPILLPDDLSHLNIEKPSGAVTESDTCFFYPSGEKNANFSDVVITAARDKMSEYRQRDNSRNKSNASTLSKHKAIKPHSSSSILGKKSTVSALSSEEKPREKLYYSRREDRKTENLLNSLRFNEAKILGVLSTKT